MAGDKLPSLMAAAARGETKRASRLGADLNCTLIERLTPKQKETALNYTLIERPTDSKLGLRKCEDWVNDEEFSSTSKITKMIKP